MLRFQSQSTAPVEKKTFKSYYSSFHYFYLDFKAYEDHRFVSRSVTSVGLNSTLQPIGEQGGGGLNLIVCQLVD